MGKDWYWSRAGRKGGTNGVEKEKQQQQHQVAGCMSGVFHLFDLHQLLFATRNAVVVADTVPWTSPADKEETLKGVEAPRNSLELDVAATTSLPSPVAATTDGYEIPFGIQLVVPKRSSSLQEQMEEERSLQGLSTARRRSNSTGTSSNVVAKLMGLDALPDRRSLSSFSPSTSRRRGEWLQSPPVVGKQWCRSNNSKKEQEKMVDGTSTRGSTPRHALQPRNTNVMTVEDDARRGTWSLPETPRMSSARWSWDSDPRLSVQSNCSTAGTGIYYNNKENVVNNNNNNMSESALQELKCVFEDRFSQLSASTLPLFRTAKAKPRTREESGRRRQSNNSVEEGKSSPRDQYAKEMVRQVKGTAGGGRNERGRAAKASETVVMTNKTPTPTPTPTPPSSSCGTSRLIQVVEDESGGHDKEKAPTPPPPTGLKSTTPPKPENSSTPTPPTKCKKLSCDRFNERLKKPSCAAPETPNAISVSSSVFPQWKSKRSNRPRQQPQPLEIDIHVAMPKKGGDGGGGREPAPAPVPVPVPVPEELHYVKRVLEEAGIRGHTLLPFAVRWNINSPSHPLDPSIFHQMELSHGHHHGPLRHRCNRKLLFDLVDELLGDLLYPYLPDNSGRTGRWSWRGRSTSTAKPPDVLDGEPVVALLWCRIQSFPAAGCRVIQDIDSLVESDIPTPNIRRLLRHPAVEDEVGTIAAEIERCLVDALLEENVSPIATWRGLRRHLT